jgi:hypothetical protein
MKNKEKNGLIYGVLFALIIISLINVAASEVNEYAPVKQGECAVLSQVCASCSYVNISIKYPAPNSSYSIYEGEMSRTGRGDWFYNYCDTDLPGRYDVTGHGDIGGTDTGFDVLYFRVTGNGNDEPDGIIIVLFSILFMSIMFFLVWELIMSVGHIANLDFDIADLSKSWGTYFALFALFWLETVYLGNAVMESWFLIFIKVGGFTHLLVPLIAFSISITIGSLKKKKFDVTKRYIKRTRIGR